MSARVVSWVQREHITPSAKKFVLRELADTSNDEGWAFGESHIGLAYKVSLTERQVRHWLHALAREGRLCIFPIRTGMGIRERNIYHVLAPWCDPTLRPPGQDGAPRQRRKTQAAAVASDLPISVGASPASGRLRCSHRDPICSECFAVHEAVLLGTDKRN